MRHPAATVVLLASSLAFALVLSRPASGSDPREVTLTAMPGKVRVEIGGQLFTEYVWEGQPKPILYPILGPGGERMTRDFPMKETDGEARDHPHHRSLWFTHDKVNGVGFWHEGDDAGREVQAEVVEATSGIGRGVLRTKTDWVRPNGEKVLTDTRTLTFSETANGRIIDFEITLHASEGDVLFGDTKEGTMGIRTHPKLRLSDNERYGVKAEGHAVNSEGAKDGDLWGKRAAWVDYWGPIDGSVVGVAIFDHPKNLRHPTWWHARDYGLVAANPFGIHDFERRRDEPTAGDVKLAKGEDLTLRYRFYFHRGDTAGGRVEEVWKDFAGDAASTKPE